MAGVGASAAASSAAVMAAVEDLIPEIQGRTAEIEAERGVPRDLVEKLRAAGCFRMAVPELFSGIGCDQSELFELYETLAVTDASVAWIVMIGSPTPSYLAPFSRATFRSVYASGPDVILAAALAPTGTATPVDGGYTVSGRWKWASGGAHADWILCNCVLMEDGAPRPGAVPGVPALRSVLLTPAEVERIDTWRVSGLRGSGSGDIAVRDLFVPEARAADMFGPPNDDARQAWAAGTAVGPFVAAVALGIARGALDDVIALAAGEKRRLGAARRMADEGVFQNRLGEADAQLRAARAAFYAQTRVWEDRARALPAGASPMDDPLHLATNATSLWVTRTCAAVVDTAYHAAGGSAVWDSANLQRRFRDIHTATQHISVSDGLFTRRGAALVGAKGA